MMKLSIIAVIILACSTASAQIKTVKLAKTTIPKSIAYKGHIVDAVKFTDAEGEHIVITTETGETPSKNGDGDDYRDAALYAYSYKVNAGKYEVSWQTYDYIKDCPVDIRADYVPNTFAVTDIDKNGKAEVWLMYRTVCHGDVSPSDMKIIMHEGNKKYAIRGTNKVKISNTQYEGGKFTFDEAFKNGPQSFRQYAQSLWKKNLSEKWDSQ